MKLPAYLSPPSLEQLVHVLHPVVFAIMSDPEKGNWLEWLFYSHRVKDTGGNSRHPAILNALEVQQVVNLLETAVQRGALV